MFLYSLYLIKEIHHSPTSTDNSVSSFNKDTPQLAPPLPAPKRTKHLSTNQVKLKEKTQLQNSLVTSAQMRSNKILLSRGKNMDTNIMYI
jgi:hypothetical protein